MADGFQTDSFQADSFQAGTTTSIPVPADIQHVAAALARLTEQFKNKPNIAALLTAYATPSQALEDAYQQLLVYRSISTASGTQLDIIGALVGQARGALSDIDYMRYILARISTNRSSGTAEELISIARSILNDSTPSIQLVVMTIAAIIVRISGTAISDSLAAILISFLRDAHAGGVKLSMESTPDVSANMLTTPICVFSNSPYGIGASSMAIESASGWPDPEVLKFPDTGTLIIDKSLATEETINYTFRGFDAGGIVFKFSGTTTKAHGSEAPLLLSTSPGLGVGDGTEGGQPALAAYSNVGTTGGRLADVRE